MKVVIKTKSDEAVTPEQLIQLQFDLQSKLRGVKLGETAPQFRSCKLINGVVYVVCVNEPTKVWLEGLVPNLKPWDNADLEIKEVPKIHKMLCTVRKALKDSEITDICAMLKEQNKGLLTENWVLFHKIENKRGTVTLFFKIDNESAKALATNNNVAFLGLEQVIFKDYVKRPGQANGPVDSDDESPQKEETKAEEPAPAEPAANDNKTGN